MELNWIEWPLSLERSHSEPGNGMLKNGNKWRKWAHLARDGTEMGPKYT